MDTDERMCQKFKQEFRKQLEFYKDNPDGLLFAYGAALNVFAKRLNSRPNSKPIIETWNELIRSVLMTMLDINKQPKAAALKKFVTLLQPWTENEAAGGISDIKENISMLHSLAINGAWEKPIFQSLINKEDIDMSELSETLKKESSLVVVNRVRALHKNKLKTSMLKVIDAALKDEQFRGDAVFQECFQLHILFDNKVYYLMEKCKDFDFAVSVKVLEKLEQEDEKQMSVTFSGAVMNYIWKNDLITSDIEKLTSSWCKIKLSEFNDNIRFVDFLKGFVRQEENGPKSVTHCLIFMQIIWEMVGNQSRGVCSDILMKALRLLTTESNPDNQNKIQILETIARLLPKTNVCRLCLLCVFFLEPCIETYYSVSDAFNSTLKNEGTKSAELQTELLLHINNEFPKGSRFEMLDWNQINEECLTKLSPDDVNLLLNDSRSPLERQTSESTDTSIDDESSPAQEDLSDANKCSKCTVDTTCGSCQEKTKPVREKPPKRKKKKKYGWTCPVDQCKVLSGRMMYLCTHLKNKHQWAKEEINAFVKSLGVKKTAIWTSTNDNLVLLHKAQMQIHEGDKNRDSISRQSSSASASDQEHLVTHLKQTNDKTDENNVSEENKDIIKKENLENVSDQTYLDDLFLEKSNDSSKHIKVENESENEQKIDDTLENSQNPESSGFQNVTNTSSPEATVNKETVDISSENILNSSAKVTQTIPDSTSNVVMQDITADETVSVPKKSHIGSEVKSKSSESKKSTKLKKSRHSLSQDREHKEKHKSMKKKHEKQRRKTVDVVTTSKRNISTDQDVKTSKHTVEERKTALVDNSISQQLTFKPHEVTKSFPDVKDPGYVCPIQDCNRVFMHRHTIVAHIRFRHKKNQTVAETLAETAKPAEADVVTMSTIENKIIKSRGWYLCVDAHIHEDEDEKVPDISGNNDTRKFLIECVRHLFKRPLMNFNYNVACNYVLKWPTLMSPKSLSPSTPDEDYFGLPPDIIESGNQSHLDEEISKTVDNGVVSQSIRPTTPVPEKEDNVAEYINNVSSSNKVKKHKVKKFNKSTQTRHGNNAVKCATDREIIPTVTISKGKKLLKPRDHNPSPTVMTGLAFGKKPMRTIAVQVEFPKPPSANKRRPSKDIVKKSKVDAKQELKEDNIKMDAKKRETPKPISQEVTTIDMSETSASIPKKRNNKGISFEQALADPNAQERNQEMKMKHTHKPAAQIQSRSISNPQSITPTKLHNIDNGDAHKIRHTSSKSDEKRSKSGERRKHKSETHCKHSQESSANAVSSREERPSSPERLSSVTDYNNLIERAKQIAGDDWSDSSKHSSSEKASTSKKSVNVNAADATKTSKKTLTMTKQKINKNKRSIDLRKLSSVTNDDEIISKVRKFDETRNNSSENMFSESARSDTGESSTAGDKHKCGICGRIMANGFALACHMRKKHKSKSKMFIPETDAVSDEKRKAKVRKKSSDDTKKNIVIKQAKNAEPVHKEGRLSTIKCAQAEILTLPSEEKPFEVLTKWQLMMHYFCEVFYCTKYRQVLERKKDIFVNRKNVAGLANELFSTERKRLFCPAPACDEDFLRHDCLKAHLSEKHCVLSGVLLQSTFHMMKDGLLRKCSSCKADFAEFTDLFNHIKQSPNCRDSIDIEGEVEYHRLGTNLGIQCFECKSQLSTFRSLLVHLRRIHRKMFSSFRNSEKWKEVIESVENSWYRAMNTSLANEATLRTKTPIVAVDETKGMMDVDEKSEETMDVDEKSDGDVGEDVVESEEDVRHTTDSGIEVAQDCEDGLHEEKAIVEDQLSMTTYDDFSSAEDSQDDIFVPEQCEPSEPSDQDGHVTLGTSTPNQPAMHDSDTTGLESSHSKVFSSESSIDNQSVSEDSCLISDGNVSSEMDMDISEDAVDLQSKVGEAKNLRRLAYTQAARKIVMKTPDKFNRRRWAEFQNLHALYNKRALKKVALSLSSAKKIETPATIEPVKEPSKIGPLAVVKKVPSGCCWVCKDEFLQGPNYENHILYHLRNIDCHENRCDFAGCLYAFKDENELVEHQLLHEGAVHKCLFCFGHAYFASAIDLLDHEKEHHFFAVKILRRLRKKFCINRFLKSEMRRHRRRADTAEIVEDPHTQNDEERFLCCRHRKRLNIRTENDSNCDCNSENNQLCIKNGCQDDNEYCNSIFLCDFVPEIQTNICDIITDVLDTLDEAEQQPIETLENYDDLHLPSSNIENFDSVRNSHSQEVVFSSTPQQNSFPFHENHELVHYGNENNDISLVDTEMHHSDVTINISRIDSELVTTTVVSTCELSPLEVTPSSSNVKLTNAEQKDMGVDGSDLENSLKTTVATISVDVPSENNLVIVKDEKSTILEKIPFEVDDVEIVKPSNLDENFNSLAVERYCGTTPTQSLPSISSMNASFLNPEHGYIANLIDVVSGIDYEEGVLYLEVANVLERIVTTVECAVQCDMFMEMGHSQFIGLLPIDRANYTGSEESVVALLHENSDDELCASKDALSALFENSSTLQTETTITIIPDTEDYEHEKLSSDEAVPYRKHDADEVTVTENRLLPHDGSHIENKELKSFFSGERVGCAFSSLFADKTHLTISGSKSAEAFKRVFRDDFGAAFSAQITKTPAIGWKNVEAAADSAVVTVADVAVEKTIEAIPQLSLGAASSTQEETNSTISSTSINSLPATQPVKEKKPSNSSTDSLDPAVKKSGTMKKSQSKKGKFVANDPFREFRGRLSKHTRNLEKQEIPEVWEPDEELFLKMFPSMAEDNCESGEMRKKRTHKSSTESLLKRLKKSNSLDSGSLIPVATKLKERNDKSTLSPIMFHSSGSDSCEANTKIFNNPQRLVVNSTITSQDHSDTSINGSARVMCHSTICGFCLKSVSYVNLLRHLVEHFQNPQNVVKCAFAGDQCFYKCRSEAEIHVHYQRHLDSRPFLCMFCSAKFSDKLALQHHQKTLHRVFRKKFFAEFKKRSDARKANILGRSLPTVKAVSAVSEVFSCPERPSVIVRSNPSCTDEKKSVFPRTNLSNNTAQNPGPHSKFWRENRHMSFRRKQSAFCTSNRSSLTLPKSRSETTRYPSYVKNGSVLALDFHLEEDDVEVLPTTTRGSSLKDKEKLGDTDNLQSSNMNEAEVDDFNSLSALANVCSVADKASEKRLRNSNSDDLLASHNLETPVTAGHISIPMGGKCLPPMGEDSLSMKQITSRKQSLATMGDSGAVITSGNSLVATSQSCCASVSMPKLAPLNDFGKGNESFRLDGTHYLPNVLTPSPVDIFPIRRYSTENIEFSKVFTSGDSLVLEGDQRKEEIFDGSSIVRRMSSNLESSSNVDDLFPLSVAERSRDVQHSIGDAEEFTVNLQSLKGNVSKSQDSLFRILHDVDDCTVDNAKRIVLSPPKLDEDAFEADEFPFHLDERDLKKNDSKHCRIPLNLQSSDVNLSKAQNSFFSDSHSGDTVKNDGHSSILDMENSETKSNTKDSDSCNTSSKNNQSCEADSRMQKPLVRKMFKLIRPAPVTIFSNTNTNSLQKSFSESRFLKCSKVTENIDLKDPFKRNNSILYTSASKSAGIHLVQAPKNKEPLCAVTRSPQSKCQNTSSESGKLSESQKLSGMPQKSTMKKYRGNYLFPASMLLSCTSNNTDSNKTSQIKMSTSEALNITDANSCQVASFAAPRAKDNASVFVPISLPVNVADQNKNNAKWNFCQSPLIPKSSIIKIDALNRSHNYQKFTAKPLQSTKPILRQISDSRFTSISYHNSQPEIIRFVKPTARKVQIVRPVMRVPCASKKDSPVSPPRSTTATQAQDANSARLFPNAITSISADSQHLNLHSSSAFHTSEGSTSTSQPRFSAVSVSNPMEQQVNNPATTRQSPDASLAHDSILTSANTIGSMTQDSTSAFASYSVTYDDNFIEVAESHNSDDRNNLSGLRRDNIVVKTESDAVVSSTANVKNGEGVAPNDGRNSVVGIVSIGIDRQVTDDDSDVFLSDEEDGRNGKRCSGLCGHFKDLKDETVDSFDLCSECGSTSASRRGLEVVKRTQTKSSYDHALMKEVWETDDSFMKKYRLETRLPSYMAKKYHWRDVRREAYEDLKAFTMKALMLRNEFVPGVVRCPVKECEKRFKLRKDLYRHLCKHSSKKLVAYLQFRYKGIRSNYRQRLKKPKVMHEKRCRFASCGRVFECDEFEDYKLVLKEFRSHMRSHFYVCSKLVKVGNTFHRVFESTVPLEDIVRPKEVLQSRDPVKSWSLDGEKEEIEDLQYFEEVSETAEVEFVSTESESGEPSNDSLNCSVKLPPVTDTLTMIEDATSNLVQAKVALVRLENLDCDN